MLITPTTINIVLRKCWREFANDVLAMPSVSHSLRVYGFNNYGAPLSLFEEIFKDALEIAISDEQQINHQDLLRFYLGLDNIPDEKIFKAL